MPVVLIAPEEQAHKEGPHTQILRDAGFEPVRDWAAEAASN